MPKQHFVALAAEISLIANPAARYDAAFAVATAASIFNPRFDRARFYKACGVN